MNAENDKTKNANGQPIRVALFIGGLEDGGSANSIFQIAAHVGDERVSTHVVSCAEGVMTERLAALTDDITLLGTGWPPRMSTLTNGRLKTRWRGRLGFIPWLLRTARRLARYVKKRQIDILHTNYVSFHLVAFLAGLRTGVPVIFHWRGIVRGRGQKLLCWLFHRILGRKAFSVANSQATLDSIAGLVRGRGSVIYNCIDEPVPDESTPDLRQMLGLDPGARLVGLTGSLTPIKGHDVFLRAAAKVSCESTHFVIIGDVTAAKQYTHPEAMKKLCTELGLDGRVSFLGFRADAAALNGQMDVATVCTLPPGEGFGLVIIEAMAVATPVISTDVGAAPEIIDGPACGVLIPAGDPDRLAAEIDRLLTDEPLRRRIGQAGRERFQAGFSQQKMCGELRSLYADLADRDDGP